MCLFHSLAFTHTHTPEYVLVENKTKQKKPPEINLEPYRQFSLNALPVFNTTTKTQVEYSIIIIDFSCTSKYYYLSN